MLQIEWKQSITDTIEYFAVYIHSWTSSNISLSIFTGGECLARQEPLVVVELAVNFDIAAFLFRKHDEMMIKWHKWIQWSCNYCTCFPVERILRRREVKYENEFIGNMMRWWSNEWWRWLKFTLPAVYRHRKSVDTWDSIKVVKYNHNSVENFAILSSWSYE